MSCLQERPSIPFIGILGKETKQADLSDKHRVGLAHNWGSPYISSEEAPVNGRWLKEPRASTKL
ncbi:protein of unknown function [Candidatus Methylomirabilis oxygeniifera]|uniref:Uncharacterized protein n=1 Tax=Methylomirabilis oxygeniifera TaxID=671143 RepID=D5MMX4_METO1|nr:protein of unknown function [Candidatus Methylomirabilis oxyfera]